MKTYSEESKDPFIWRFCQERRQSQGDIMRRNQVPVAMAAILATSLLHAQQPVPEVPGLPQAAHAAAVSIDSEKIRAHVRFLSLDLLEGRGPGTRGDSLAAEYIATQFALDGLEPAGDTGTWFQRVPLHTRTTVSLDCTATEVGAQ